MLLNYFYRVSTASDPFFDLFYKQIDWYTASKYFNLSEEQILKYRHHIYWAMACKHQEITTNIIHQCKNLIHWENVCKYQTLSKCILYTYDYCLDYFWISRFQHLPSDFIEEKYNLLYLPWIKKYQLHYLNNDLKDSNGEDISSTN